MRIIEFSPCILWVFLVNYQNWRRSWGFPNFGHGKRDFAVIIKVRNLKIGRLFGMLGKGWGGLISWTFKSGDVFAAEVRRGSREIWSVVVPPPALGSRSPWKAWDRMSASFGSKDWPQLTASKQGGTWVLQLHRTELGNYPNDLGDRIFSALADYSPAWPTPWFCPCKT